MNSKNNMTQNNDDMIENMDLLENKQKNLDKMARYFFTKICRRRFILEYFGQIPKYFCCNNCDNCCERETTDFTEKVKQVVFKPIKSPLNFTNTFDSDELSTLVDSDLISKVGSYYVETQSLKNWKQILIVNKKIDCIPEKYKLLLPKKIEEKPKHKTRTKIKIIICQL